MTKPYLRIGTDTEPETIKRLHDRFVCKGKFRTTTIAAAKRFCRRYKTAYFYDPLVQLGSGSKEQYEPISTLYVNYAAYLPNMIGAAILGQPVALIVPEKENPNEKRLA